MFPLFTYLLSHLLGKKSFKKNNTSSKNLRTYPVVGNLPHFIKNRHRFLEWMTEVLKEQPTNTVTFWRPGKMQGVITAKPLNVEHMLKTNFENYRKGDRFICLLEDFVGNGIFNSDGDMESELELPLISTSCSYNNNIHCFPVFVV